MGKPKLGSEIEQKIYELRRKGFSIPEINKDLGVPKSTILRYCRKVDILPEYKTRWLERRNASKIISENAWKKANEGAQLLISDLSTKELMLIGAALYWAEGTKKDLSFINSDPEMIKLFILILVKACKIPYESIKISLRLFENIPTSEAINFWSEITGVKLNSETKIHIVKGDKLGKFKYGMCRVRVARGGLLLKSFFAINKRVLQVVAPRSSMDRASHS